MMIKDLKGIHHVTAMTSSAEKNYAFFTEVLGMRLVKNRQPRRYSYVSFIFRR